MKTIDITFDLETCAVCPNAAVMSLGAVAWDSQAELSPFMSPAEEYSDRIDLRSMFIDGFEFDPATARWWSKQDAEAKKSLLADANPSFPCSPVDKVVRVFFSWIENTRRTYEADTVYLWCQGTDFDMAILRNICHKYKVEIPVSHRHFRDHRTFYLENVRMLISSDGMLYEEDKAYDYVQNYAGTHLPHDPIFDCKRSIWSTWQIMKQMRARLERGE